MPKRITLELFLKMLNAEIIEAREELKDPDCRGHLASLASGYLEGLMKALELASGEDKINDKS